MRRPFRFINRIIRLFGPCMIVAILQRNSNVPAHETILSMNFNDSRRFESTGVALSADAPILAHEDTGLENAALS